MREIKFRFWDTRSKKMYPEMERLWTEPVNVWFSRAAENGIVVLQYTGAHDKNGKEIYEGDILKHDLWGHTQVIWEHGMFRGQNGKDWNDMIDATLADHQLNRSRVVGNAYENPELLDAS